MLTLLLGAALAQDVDCYLLTADLPDPGAAVGLSAFVGFGTGHAYARRPGAMGWVLVDAIATGILISGAQTFAPDEVDASGATTVEEAYAIADEAAADAKAFGARSTVGLAVLAVSHAGQAVTVAQSVHETRRNMAAACAGQLQGNLGPAAAQSRANQIEAALTTATTAQALKALGLNSFSLEAAAVEGWVEEQLRSGVPASTVIGLIKEGQSPFEVPQAAPPTVPSSTP